MTNTGIKNIRNAITDNIKRHSGALKHLLPVFCAFHFVACATTSITNVWKDKAYEGKAKKIVVIMVSKDPDRRRLFEGRFSAELEARGNDAIPSFTFIPLEQLPDKELIKSKLKSIGVDTVLVSRLVDIKTIEAYRPGFVYVVPDFYFGWGTYYSVISADSGYTVDVQVAYVETNVYDMKTEKLVWSAHTKTERTEGEQQLINAFSKVIIKKLSSDGIIR